MLTKLKQRKIKIARDKKLTATLMLILHTFVILLLSLGML